MRKQDAVFVISTFCSMILGVFMPFAAEPLRWVPRATMLTLLFVGFLSIDGRDVWRSIVRSPGAIVMLAALKLCVMPVACWAVFSLCVPEYALAAALLGGSSTAVVAPFYAFLVQADFVLVLAGLVVTSLLLPFVLPLVLALLGMMGLEQGGAQFDLDVWAMTANLAVMTIVPFVGAQFLRQRSPKITEGVLRRRLVLFTGCASCGNVAVFSQYSSTILQSPQYLLTALGCAFLAALVFFVLSAGVSFWLSPVKQLAFVISCVAMNNVLMLIISVEFFTVTEALFAAMYTAPFLLSIFAFRRLGRLRGHNPE